MNYIDIHDNFLTVKSYNSSIQEIVDGLKSYILNHDCERICVDISVLTLIDATKTSVLCSAYHFAKYPSGYMRWIVKDLEIKKTITPMALKNVEIIAQKAIIPNFEPSSGEALYCLK